MSDYPVLPSPKSYVVKAIYHWAIEHYLTPCLLFLHPERIQIKGIPSEVFTGKKDLVLNISPQAARDLQIGNEYLTCGMRFGSYLTEVEIAINDIDGFYIREIQEYINLEALSDTKATRFLRDSHYKNYMRLTSTQDLDEKPAEKKPALPTHLKIIK